MNRVLIAIYKYIYTSPTAVRPAICLFCLKSPLLLSKYYLRNLFGKIQNATYDYAQRLVVLMMMMRIAPLSSRLSNSLIMIHFGQERCITSRIPSHPLLSHGTWPFAWSRNHRIIIIWCKSNTLSRVLVLSARLFFETMMMMMFQRHWDRS